MSEREALNAGTGCMPVPEKEASANVISLIVTLPVLVTVNVYRTSSPAITGLPRPETSATLLRDNDGTAGRSTSVGSPGSPGMPGLFGSGVDGTGVIGTAGLPGSV